MITKCTAMDDGSGLEACFRERNDMRSRLISYINDLEVGFLLSEVYIGNHES